MIETTEPKIILNFNLVQIRHDVLEHGKMKMPLFLLASFLFLCLFLPLYFRRRGLYNKICLLMATVLGGVCISCIYLVFEFSLYFNSFIHDNSE